VKTYKQLYPQISSFDNLDFAWRKALRSKRSKAAVAAFEFNALLTKLPKNGKTTGKKEMRESITSNRTSGGLTRC
jgi:hypothetical protein